MVQKLTEKQERVLLLREVGHFSFSQIDRILKTSRSWESYHRAKKINEILRRRLKKQERIND